jgi:hypothetical protein
VPHLGGLIEQASTLKAIPFDNASSLERVVKSQQFRLRINGYAFLHSGRMKGEKFASKVHSWAVAVIEPFILVFQHPINDMIGEVSDGADPRFDLVLRFLITSRWIFGSVK